MKLILAIGIALSMVAGLAFAQCGGCPGAKSCGSAAQSGGLAELKLVNLAGDTVKLSDHVGKMPIVMLLAGVGEASGKAIDVVQTALSAQGQGPVPVYVLAAGSKPAKAFAKSHDLTGLVLVDQQKTALAAAMADTLPVALFIDRSGAVVEAVANITEATVSKGLRALAQTEQKLVDPVCGMTVTKETAAAKYDYQGKTYYFCNQSCKESFAKDPQKYLAQ